MKKESLKQKAYSIIKSKIINCEYPPNAFLNESILMKEVNASRTPIREALNKLEQENLLTIIPKKGLIVSPLTINDINVLYQTRSLIEPFIIQTHGASIDKDYLLRIRDAIQNDINADNKDMIYKIDNDLHQFLIASSNNKYFKQTMEQIYDQNHRLRILSGISVAHRLEQTQAEHLAIIDLLLDSKVDEAADAMRLHLENSKNASYASLVRYAELTSAKTL